MQSLLERIARTACRHPKSILLGTTLLTLLSLIPVIWKGTHAAFDITRMLPQHLPAARAFTRAVTDFGSADVAMVVFHLDGTAESVRIAGAVADRIVTLLRDSDEIETAYCRKIAETEKEHLLQQELPRRGLLLLSEEDIHRVAKRLEPEEIRRAVRRTARQLASGVANESTEGVIAMDVLGLASILESSLRELLGKPRDESPKVGPYIVDKEKKMMLLIAHPKHPAQDIRFAKKIMTLIRQITQETIEGSTPFLSQDLRPDSPLLVALRENTSPPLRRLWEALPPDARSALLAQPTSSAIASLNEALRDPTLFTTEDLWKSVALSASASSALEELRNGNVPPERVLRLNRLLLASLLPTAAETSGWNGLSPAARRMIRIEFGGGYEAAVRYNDRVASTLFGTLITSLIGVILLFGYFFRRYGVLIYIGTPLLMIVAWTAGIGCLIFGQLNIISCAFAAVLVGLGVDYAVHLYNRYIEERARGIEMEEAFVLSFVHTGWGILIGMTTTCLAFFALHATSFRQIAEFGILAGLGIALSFPGMLLILPALIAWRTQHGAEHRRILSPTHFFLPHLATLVERHPKKILAFGILLALACGLRLLLAEHPLHFDERMSTLRPSDRTFELNGEIARAFSNRNPTKLYLVAYAEEEREAMEEAARLTEGCKRLVEEGLILDYESLMRFVPAPSVQERRLDALAKIDFEGALATFRQALAQQKMAEEPFEFTLRLLREHGELVKRRRIILLSDFEHTPLWPFMSQLVARHRRTYYLKEELPPPDAYPVVLTKPVYTRSGEFRYAAGTRLTEEEVRALAQEERLEHRVKSITVLDRGWTIKAHIYPPLMKRSKVGDPQIDQKWTETVCQRLRLPSLDREDFDRNGRGSFLTGTLLLTHELASIVRQDFIELSEWVFGICALTLAIFYHRYPIRLLYCLLPLSLGLLYLLGLMSYASALGDHVEWLHGIKFYADFNFVNILTIPIIIGLGVDNGIHLVNRYFESQQSIRPVIADTGRALMITSLTSMAGFGSLAVSRYGGITSMGVLVIAGLCTTLFASLVVFPALLSIVSPSSAPSLIQEDQTP